jgi:hypothetical protein
MMSQIGSRDISCFRLQPADPEVAPSLRPQFFVVFGPQNGYGEKKDISFEEKLIIQAWLLENVKTTDIAAQLACAASAFRKHIAVLKKLPLTALPTAPPTSPPPPSKAWTGRKMKVTKRMTERLKIYVTRNHFKTARELKNEVYGWSEISV